MPPKKNKLEYDSDTLPEDILIDLIGKITAKDNKLKQIRELFEEHPEIDTNAANVLKPVKLEGQGGDVEEQGEDEEEEYEDIVEDTVVSLAVKKNAPEVVEEMMVMDADLSIPIGEKEDTIFHILARTGNASMLKVILNKLEEMEKKEMEFENTQEEEVEDDGEPSEDNDGEDTEEDDSRKQTSSKNTPAFKVEPHFYENIVMLLSIKNAESQTVMDIAVEVRNSNISHLLLKYGAEYDFLSSNEAGLPLLHQAVVDGDSRFFEYLLNMRLSPFSKDTSRQCRSVLHHAAIADRRDICDILVKRLAGKITPEFVDSEDTDGATALSLAIEHGHWDMVKLLTTKLGASIDHLSSVDGMNVLHRAASQRNRPLVEHLVNSLKMKVTDVDRDGSTPLHWSASADAPEISKFLIDKKADINAMNGKRNTPLRNACLMGNIEVVKLLLEQKKIDHMVVNKDGRNVLHEIAQKGHVELLEMMLRYEEDRFNETKKKGSTEEFKSVLIEQEDHCGHTPLEVAIHAGQVMSAVTLIDKGANVDRQYKSMLAPQEHAGHNEEERERESNTMDNASKDGFVTILQHAVCLQYEKVVERILQVSQKDVNTVDMRGRSPLHNAVLLDNPNLSHLIASCETCNVDMKEVDRGYTPLMIACERSHFEICNMLVTEFGASHAVQDLRGMTALHIASQKFEPDIVTMLVEQGADVNRRDLKYRTPLHAACEVNNHQVVQYLIQNDANIAAEDSSGHTALHVAAMNGSVECVEVLIESGAVMNARDSKGRTPLMLASEMGQTSCGGVLVVNWDKRRRAMES